MGFACSDETTVISTTGEKLGVDMPYNFTVNRVYGSLTTAGTTSAFTVDVEDEGTTILASEAALSFAAAANNAEIDGSFASAATEYTFTKGDRMTIDVGAVDSGGTAAGLKIFLEGYRS
jgi:hypothetical protein